MNSTVHDKARLKTLIKKKRITTHVMRKLLGVVWFPKQKKNIKDNNVITETTAQ